MTTQNKQVIANTSIKELLYSGVHFGHKKKRWNPKMAPFIYGSKGDIHIINLEKTKIFLDSALTMIARVVKNNGKVLFVGTKHQATAVVKKHAEECQQFYVNHRWLGGMLTNWSTISNSIKSLEKIERDLANPEVKITKKERLQMQKKYDKLTASLGGIRKMSSKPAVIFVIDTNKESIAVQEAAKLGIPVVAITDTNSSLDNIAFPIPGNDDSIKSISLFCKYVADTINLVKPGVSQRETVAENLTGNKLDITEEVRVKEDESEEKENKTSNKSEKSAEENKVTKNAKKSAPKKKAATSKKEEVESSEEKTSPKKKAE